MLTSAAEIRASFFLHVGQRTSIRSIAAALLLFVLVKGKLGIKELNSLDKSIKVYLDIKHVTILREHTLGKKLRFDPELLNKELAVNNVRAVCYYAIISCVSLF